MRSFSGTSPSGGLGEGCGAYDAANDAFYYYGGQNNGPLADLWRFDGCTRTWSLLASYPGWETSECAMAFRPSQTGAENDRLYIQGPVNGASMWFSIDLGACTGPSGTCSTTTSTCGTPTSIISGPAPWSALLAASLEWDSSRDVVILFGGETASPFQAVNEVWEYDGTVLA